MRVMGTQSVNSYLAFKVGHTVTTLGLIRRDEA